MSPGVARYAAGRGTAVSGPGGVGLVDATVGGPDDAVQAVVDAVIAGDGIDVVVDRLMAVGVRRLPDFALAFIDGDQLRLLLRGAVSVAVADTTGAVRHVDGTGFHTWREVVLDDCATIRLSLLTVGDDDDGAAVVTPFALIAGSAPAGALAHSFAGDPVPAAEPAAVVPADDHDDDDPDEAGVDDAGDAGGVEVEDTDATDEPAPASSPVGVAPPPPAADDDDFDFGHLLGDTRYETVEAGAVRAADPGAMHDEPPPARTGPIADATSAPATGDSLDGHTKTFETTDRPALDSLDRPPADAVPSPPPPAPPAPPTGAVTLIDAVPGMPSPGDSPSPPASAAPPVGDPPPPRPGDRLIAPPPPGVAAAWPPPVGTPAPMAPPVPMTPAPPASRPAAPPAARAADPHDDPAEEGPTIGVAALRALRAGSAVTAPSIQAVHCPAHHPNPPYAETCRRCGTAIEDRAVSVVPRPCLGQLTFEDGTVVVLDQPVLLGRKPPTDAVVNGEPARAVSLQDPDMVLSRLHVEIRLVDWQVLVVDRDSMNHTFVEVPGHATIQLRPAEPFPILLGSVIGLGDAVRATYEIEPG